MAESGRVVKIAAPSSERFALAPKIGPGAPPLLSFRLFDGGIAALFHPDLFLDDAGH